MCENDEEIVACDRCGNELPESELFWTFGEALCLECYEEAQEEN